jgi:hypothetical protein
MVLGALVYIDMQRFEEAIFDCEQAIQLNNQWVKAYIRKATAHREIIADPMHDDKALEVSKTGLQIAKS